MPIDARLAYDVWLLLVADEELYRATLEGTHRALAGSRGLGEAQLEVLDAFHAAPGTRWNVENLRFRTALEVGATLASYLPRTVKLLTKGDPDWLQDISFEYLAHHRWKEHGHRRFTECERFGAYVRERILKRRIPPPHLEVALDFELAIVRLLKRTAEIPPERWPAAPPLDDAALAGARVCRAPAVELVELGADIRAWIESGDPLRGEVGPGPVTFLAWVPSLQDTHRIKRIGEGPRLILERLDGARTAAAVIAELADEFEIDPAEILGLVRGWLEERILAIAPAG